MANRSWRRPRHTLIALGVLGLLCECPLHPYQMQRRFQERHKDFAKGQPRALYHAVDRLAEAGLIEPVETVREGHRPERTVYQITASGREECRMWLLDLLATPQVESPIFSATVGMIGYLAKAEVVAALQSRQASLQGLIARIDTVLQALQRSFGLPRLFLIEREYERSLWQAELTWVGELITALKAGELKVDRRWLEAVATAGERSESLVGEWFHPLSGYEAEGDRPARPGRPQSAPA
ncbi:MAG: PadR family transcriptional regulator [Candidatus Dormibacteria bacterium]